MDTVAPYGARVMESPEVLEDMAEAKQLDTSSEEGLDNSQVKKNNLKADLSLDHHTEDEIVAALPPWHEQITIRGYVVGLILGVGFSFITMRFSLGSGGWVPTFNMPTGLIAFVLLKFVTTNIMWFDRKFPKWNWLVRGWGTRPFTPQENTVVQTFAMALTSACWFLGFGAYIQGLSYQSYLNTGGDATDGNLLTDVYEPKLHNLIPFGLCIAFLGIFCNLILRKPLVIDYNLPYPTGTATGVMITSFFSDGNMARRQAKMLLSTGIFAFVWDFWWWFFNGTCKYSIAYDPDIVGYGIQSMPNLGVKAFNVVQPGLAWYFEFGIPYIGAGFITPLWVNVGMMEGAIVSWGLAWPLIKNREGSWYDVGLPTHSFRGQFAYRVFFSIALFMGEGVYQIVKMLYLSFTHWRATRAALASANGQLPVINQDLADDEIDPLGIGIAVRETPEQHHLRKRVFLLDTFAWYYTVAGYIVFFIIGTVAIPHIYPPAKWYYCATAYAIAPFMAVANAYIAGLTDQDNSSMFGKFCIFIFAAWAGSQNDGVVVGLVVCGIVLSTTSQAAVLMQDFRTGYYTLSAPKALFTSQVLGALVGCFVAPLVFEFYAHAFKIGVDKVYLAPYGDIYRSMAIVASVGVGQLPKYCLAISGALFGAAIALDAFKDFLCPRKYRYLVPIPSAVAIPFYIGATFSIDFCLGGAIAFAWRYFAPAKAAIYVIPAGAGLMVGDGLWQLPAGILGLLKVVQPICMAWFPGVDQYGDAANIPSDACLPYADADSTPYGTCLLQPADVSAVMMDNATFLSEVFAANVTEAYQTCMAGICSAANVATYKAGMTG